jgi:two-component sensor histidine kinase
MQGEQRGRSERPWAGYDLIPERVAVFEASGPLIFANAAWRTAGGPEDSTLLSSGDLATFIREAAASPALDPSFASLADHFQLLLSGESPGFDHECSGVSPSGRSLACRVRARRERRGRRQVVVVLHQDLSAERGAERELRRALADRETLLREVHHRVKNNLQVISSLLALQVRTLDSDSARRALADTRMRVRAIAAVHERLCESEDLARLDLGEYIKTIVPGIISSAAGGGPSLRLEMDVDTVFVGLDDAVRCGLIVNELVVNAIQHAFAHRADGVVTVRLRRLDAEHARLTVADDGVGLPDGIDPARVDSLGLHLASGLAQRLGGALQIERDRGTTFSVALRTTTMTP